MEKDSFLNKINSEFVIITNNIDFDIVTNALEIEPTRFFNKGDKFTSKYSSRVGYKPHGLWGKQSDSIISEEIDVSIHIRYFQKLLENKIEVLTKLKQKYQFEFIFIINIETEDAGIGLDLNSAELKFISKIASRYSCSFISKETVV